MVGIFGKVIASGGSSNASQSWGEIVGTLSDQTDLQNALNDKQDAYSVNAQTGTSYTIQASDAGKLITFNNASDVTVTLPQQSTLSTTTSFSFDFENIGAGKVTFVKEGSETITNTSNVEADLGAKGTIRRPTTTSWSIEGGTSVFVWEHSINVEIVSNVTYNAVKFNFEGLLTSISTKSRSGTCTATTSIDGTPVTATANSVSTSDDTQAVTATNSFATTDYLTTAITSNSSCEDMIITYSGTYRENI